MEVYHTARCVRGSVANFWIQRTEAETEIRSSSDRTYDVPFASNLNIMITRPLQLTEWQCKSLLIRCRSKHSPARGRILNMLDRQFYGSFPSSFQIYNLGSGDVVDLQVAFIFETCASMDLLCFSDWGYSCHFIPAPGMQPFCSTPASQYSCSDPFSPGSLTGKNLANLLWY